MRKRLEVVAHHDAALDRDGLRPLATFHLPVDVQVLGKCVELLGTVHPGTVMDGGGDVLRLLVPEEVQE